MPRPKARKCQWNWMTLLETGDIILRLPCSPNTRDRNVDGKWQYKGPEPSASARLWHWVYKPWERRCTVGPFTRANHRKNRNLLKFHCRSSPSSQLQPKSPGFLLDSDIIESRLMLCIFSRQEQRALPETRNSDICQPITAAINNLLKPTPKTCNLVVG